ncbi:MULTISPECIES: phage protease [unclassified Acinetobacter]|uniref:phage protease n=1 Tax=unclassified Acinetobacter TaxID=196816 RepID=UPI001909BCFF|nr:MULTISPECIES: phage protease [unclassified Acinetobacter]MBK0063960.1 phage protease [Acinetobacter sp. S55]MBK0067245.1 phage protease [Acinetobacter sp. S54]
MTDSVLVAQCSFDLTASSDQADYLVLVPEGVFRGVDGRPFDAPHWLLTPERGRQIVAALNQRNIDMVIDYEHATLKSQVSGEPAPAAGWLKSESFRYIDGVGICSAQFEWLDKAKGFIESGEYKYLSPVLFYNKLGEVLALINVALTNTPALDQLPEAKLAAAAQEFFALNNDEDSTMKEFLELMRKKLGLAETATDEEFLVAANSAFTKLDDAFGTAFVKSEQTLVAAIEQAIEVKAAANSQTTPDPAKYVPMAVYQEAVAKAGNADAAVKAKEIDDLIVAACSDGRLTGEATINWVKDQAKTNPDFVKAHLEGLPKIAALSQRQTETINLGGGQQQKQLTPEVQQVATLMGIEIKAGE